MVISLEELDITDNLENGRPSNVLLRYHVIDPQKLTRYEPVTPQYKKLKNRELTFLNLKITDQNGNTITYAPGIKIDLH